MFNALRQLIDQLSSRLFISDRSTDRSYLVDTGSDVSLIPVSVYKSKLYSEDLKLYAANGMKINTFGKKL